MKIEVAVRVEQAFDRAGTLVGDGAGCGHRHGTHGPAQRGAGAAGQRRRGRLFEQFLMPALHRAIAFAQVHDMAVAIGEDLDLDVARLVNRAFEQQVGRTECTACLRACADQRAVQFRRGCHQTHAAATAAGRGLDHQRVADARGLRVQRGVVLLLTVVAGYAGHAGRVHQSLGARLVAHGADGRGVGSDPDQTGIEHGLGKVGVFGQEAVARMDGVGL